MLKGIKRNIRGSLLVLLGLYIFLIIYFVYNIFIYSDRWFSDPNNARVKVDMINPSIIPGSILDRNNNILVETKSKVNKNGEVSYFRSYSKNSRYAAHVVGSRKLGIGGEVLYVRYLLGYNNNLFERVYQKAFLERERGNDVVLTVDIRLQKYISQVMGSRKGSVVLINPSNGEVLAMVSNPSFDPSVDANEYEEESLLNKAAFGRYTPGSIMKVITAAAGLGYLDGIMNLTVECTGTTNINGVVINCFNNSAHGNVDLNKAMEVSCNAYFAKLSLDLGWSELLKAGRQFGFNQDFIFSDIKTRQSDLPLNRKTSAEELAWSGIGQGRVLASPLHMALVAAALANDGVMLEPKLIHGIQLRNGQVVPGEKAKVISQAVSKDIADKIKDTMVSAVEKGTGKNALVGGLSIGGKTGTAEVGAGLVPHAWFIGFAPAETPTLAIAVILENAGTGGGQAAPLAGKILREAKKLGY